MRESLSASTPRKAVVRGEDRAGDVIVIRLQNHSRQQFQRRHIRLTADQLRQSQIELVIILHPVELGRRKSSPENAASKPQTKSSLREQRSLTLRIPPDAETTPAAFRWRRSQPSALRRCAASGDVLREVENRHPKVIASLNESGAGGNCRVSRFVLGVRSRLRLTISCWC